MKYTFETINGLVVDFVIWTVPRDKIFGLDAGVDSVDVENSLEDEVLATDDKFSCPKIYRFRNII